MVISRILIEWFAGINCVILQSQLEKSIRFTAPLTRSSKTKFAIVKWRNLCLQIIHCYPLN